MRELHELSKKFSLVPNSDDKILEYHRGNMFDSTDEIELNVESGDSALDREAIELFEGIGALIPQEFSFSVIISPDRASFMCYYSTGFNSGGSINIDLKDDVSIYTQLEHVDWIDEMGSPLQFMEESDDYERGLRQFPPSLPPTTELRKDFNSLAAKWKKSVVREKVKFGCFCVDPRYSLDMILEDEELYSEAIRHEKCDTKSGVLNALTDFLSFGLHPIWVYIGGLPMKAAVVDATKSQLIKDRLREGSVSRNRAELRDLTAAYYESLAEGGYVGRGE